MSKLFVRVSRPLRSVLLACALLLPGMAVPAANPPMLPQIYSGQVDVSGWLMSEKLDGVRAVWDGRRLRSRRGNPFAAHVTA